MLASVARMIDAASQPFAPLETVTRSMVHTDPTVARSSGANIRIRAGAIGDGLRGRQCSWDELIRRPTEPVHRRQNETIALAGAHGAAVPS
jgi:hypothetical protein